MNRAEHAPGPRDLGVAVALGSVALVVFALTFQERLYGDASFLHFMYVRDEANYHVAHYAVTALFRALGADVPLALRLATLVPAAIAPAVLYLGLRRTGASLASSILCTALASASSSAYFFSTTIEVHAVQMAAANLGFFVLACLPGRSLPRAVAIGLVGAALLVLGHTTAVLVLPAVLVLFWRRERESGIPRARLARWFALLGVVAAAGAVVVVRHFQDEQSISFDQLVDWALWDLAPAPGDDLPAPLRFLERQLVRPLFLLLPLASIGLVVDAFRERTRALVTALWIGVPAYVLAGVPFNERGAYFLTVVAAAAWTLAHLVDRLSRFRLVVVPLLAGALVVQGIVATHKQNAWDRPLPPEGAAWVAGLLEASGGRGLFLTADPRHFAWADGYTTIVAESSLKVLSLPPDEVREYTATYAAWARRATDTGDPLYVDAAIAELARHDPTARRSLEALEAEFELTAVESGPFRALRGR